MGFNMEFFNNKRLLVILSGVACIMMALVIFVVSLIGIRNLGAFMFGINRTPTITEPPIETPAQTGEPEETPSPTPPPTSPTPTPDETPPPTPTPTEEPTPTPSPTPTPDIQVASLTINQGTTLNLTAGDSINLAVTIAPPEAVNRNIIWSSSNQSVALVDTNGRVTTIAEGFAYITATATTGTPAQIRVTVAARTVPVTSIEVTNLSGNAVINVGDSVDFLADVFPTNATNRNVSWSINVPASIANIQNQSNNRTRLTAIAPGTVTITATAGGRTGTIQITIIDPNAGYG